MKSPKRLGTGARIGLPGATFFESAAAFRTWLSRGFNRETEIWVGFHHKGTRAVQLDYSDALDIALCFGWIDGIRKKLGETTYTNRFTPRRPGSIWSRVNIARVERLKAAGLMHQAGLAAYDRRNAARSGVYSFEQRPERLPPELERQFRRNSRAWRHFSAQPAGYRRLSISWIVSAKHDETRLRRLGQLIGASARGLRLGVLSGQTGTVPTPASKRRPGAARTRR